MNRDLATTHRVPVPVLYVEDHPINAMLMAALLERRPRLKLVVAQNGAEAVRRAADLHPAILLLDLRLPDCHGSQLLPLLRQLPGCENVPAVAVTAEDDFRIAGTGFCEMWSKPLDLAHVLARLDVLVPSAGATAAARRTEALSRQPLASHPRMA